MAILPIAARPFPLSSHRLAIAVLAAICAAGAAQATPQHCPAAITVSQTAQTLPPGFQPFDSEQRHNWVNAQFSEGPPSEQAWLAPDSTRRQGKSLVASWRFTAGAEGIWLACGYTGTSIVAARRLPDTVHSCEVRFDTGFSPPAATAIDCR